MTTIQIILAIIITLPSIVYIIFVIRYSIYYFKYGRYLDNEESNILSVKEEGEKMKRNKYTQEIPKCFNCNCEMVLDHRNYINYNYNINQDNYFVCKKCNSEIIQNVKNGKIIRNLYIDEDGKIINIEQVR